MSVQDSVVLRGNRRESERKANSENAARHTKDIDNIDMAEPRVEALSRRRSMKLSLRSRRNP